MALIVNEGVLMKVILELENDLLLDYNQLIFYVKIHLLTLPPPIWLRVVKIQL